VLLVAREGEELKFDVKTQKCIYYKNITHLRMQLVQFMQRQLAEAEPGAAPGRQGMQAFCSSWLPAPRRQVSWIVR
jgi:hypothetical protein